MSACVWCGTTDSQVVLRRRDRLGTETFTYRRCVRCELIRLDPLLPLGVRARHYPPDYEAFQDREENWFLRQGLRRYWSRRVDVVYDLLPLAAGAALDVGCATGQFLSMLQQRGWHVSGVEPNAKAAAQASRRLGPGRIQAVPLEEVTFPAASFDLVTLWDVLDHLQDPPASLRAIRGWLRPGGLLVLGVPSLESWDAHLFGPAWIGWDAPRHLYLFPTSTLRTILREMGFEVVSSRCFYGGYGSFLSGLEFIRQERLGETRVGRLVGRTLALRLWRYLLWPYFRVAEWAGRGPIRTYFCRPAA